MAGRSMHLLNRTSPGVHRHSRGQLVTKPPSLLCFMLPSRSPASAGTETEPRFPWVEPPLPARCLAVGRRRSLCSCHRRRKSFPRQGAGDGGYRCCGKSRGVEESGRRKRGLGDDKGASAAEGGRAGAEGRGHGPSRSATAKAPCENDGEVLRFCAFTLVQY